MFTSKVETGEEEGKGKGTKKVRHEVRDGIPFPREMELGTRNEAGHQVGEYSTTKTSQNKGKARGTCTY